VLLDDGTRIGCGTLINAAGSGAAALVRGAGIDLPVQAQARKRCVLHVRSPALTPSCPRVIDPNGVYFGPAGTGWLCGVAPPAAEDPPSAAR